MNRRQVEYVLGRVRELAKCPVSVTEARLSSEQQAIGSTPIPGTVELEGKNDGDNDSNAGGDCDPGNSDLANEQILPDDEPPVP